MSAAFRPARAQAVALDGRRPRFAPMCAAVGLVRDERPALQKASPSSR